MILKELLEASTFRKRSTSEMTFGFEFEILVDKTQLNFPLDVIKNTLKKQKNFKNWFQDQNLSLFISKENKPKYGFASKEETENYNIKNNPYEANLVKEILKLNDKSYQLYYLLFLNKSFNKFNYLNNIQNIKSVSDFDDFLKKNFQISFLEKKFNTINQSNDSELNNNIIKYINNFFPYEKNLINDDNIKFVYDKDKNLINLENVKTIKRIKELFTDFNNIRKIIYENYDEYIDNLMNKMISNEHFFILETTVKDHLEKKNITNVDVKYDTSLKNSGIEIVTDKINGIDEAIKIFNEISGLIQNEDAFYTNKKTGLHINIGTWNDISKLDLTKLLVFSNETQILKNMERQDNKYTESLINNLVYNLKNEENYQNFNKIIRNMNEKILDNADHTYFMDFNKLINNGYIEIRGFGNKDYEYKSDYIIKMIRYLSRIMEIASDSEEAKQQYIKKLYKVFNLETKLSGEKQENISNNSVLSNDEISTILRFFPVNVKNYYEKKLKNSEEITIILLRLLDYDKKLTNGDLRILYKLLKNIDISKNYYENNIKGKSEKIDKLFQNYILKGKL